MWIPQTNKIHRMDALQFVRLLPDNYLHCVITSPTYYGLRDYGVEGHWGLESTFGEWLEKHVLLFREIRRALRPDGVCFINMGDAYASTPNGRSAADTKAAGGDDRTFRDKPINTAKEFRPKNLMGQPHRLVFALQDDGWYWRDEIVWHKPNPMPESAKDRCTRAHEFVFMLTKNERYWYDQAAIREPAQDWGSRDRTNGKYHNPGTGLTPHTGLKDNDFAERGRNKRSVWTVLPEPFAEAHFATFPTELIKPMILAGCPETVCAKCGAPHVRIEKADGGILGKSWHDHENDLMQGAGQVFKVGKVDTYTRKTIGFEPSCKCGAGTMPGLVYDPFMGAGTTALVARNLGRDYIGSELNPEYIKIAEDRLRLPFEKKQIVPADKPLDKPVVVIGETVLQQTTLFE